MSELGFRGLYDISFALSFIGSSLLVLLGFYADFYTKLRERAHKLKTEKATLLYTYGKEKNSSIKESLGPLLKDLSHIR